MLEPTLGNQNQEFLYNWHSKLKQVFLSLMEDILQFCNKTINITIQELITNESPLKASINYNNWFQEIKVEIMKNKESST